MYDVSHSRRVEVGEVGPVAQASGVPANADPRGVRGRRSIEDEELVPVRRRDMRVRGRGDGAHVTSA